MIPKKPVPDLIRDGYRFSEKIMLQPRIYGSPPLAWCASQFLRIVRFFRDALVDGEVGVPDQLSPFLGLGCQSAQELLR